MFALELTDAYKTPNLINKKFILRLINELLRSEGLNREASLIPFHAVAPAHRCLVEFITSWPGKRSPIGATMPVLITWVLASYTALCPDVSSWPNVANMW